MSKDITVRDFILCGGELTFRRWLPDFLNEQWQEVKRRMLNIPLNNIKDQTR
jgi:hypothetical protein